ncbi:MAG: FlgO family outer membrane protein [Campylobacterota bacterium]|nr:FlgO family outer membrane protein [Campylobacterota bacterium]
MKSIIKLSFLFLIVAIVVGGCSRNRIMRAPDLPTSVTALTEELTARATDKKEVNGQKIILTSMVDVNDFRQSSNFGRLYSDSIMTNLERFGWTVIDFRGVNVISEVKEGEFYLDRSKLKDFGDDYLVVVGTYGIYDEQLLVNVRILEPSDNRLVVSSNVLIDDPQTVKLALTNHCTDLSCGAQENAFNMMIKCDDCESTPRCGDCSSEHCTNGTCSGDIK